MLRKVVSYADNMVEQSTAFFCCDDVSVGVAGRVLVNRLHLDIDRGEFIAVIGQNGVGKTLTMHALAGIRAANSGNIAVDGLPVTTTRREEIARRLALLPQHVDDIFPATVLDTVMIGRHPHIGRFGWETSNDVQIAMRALASVGLEEFAARDVQTLSGGERRRLAIAQIITQQPDVYLLDEPTNHLDPQHQLEVLQLFRDRADAGAVVIANLHDVNLGVRYADRCLLLYGDGQWELGRTTDILNSERLSALYGTPMEALDWRSQSLFVASGNVPT